MAVIPYYTTPGIGGTPGQTLYQDSQAQEAKLARAYEYAPQFGGKRFNQQLALQEKLGTMPHLLKQERFGALFPYLTGQQANIQNQIATAGGQSTGQPKITAGPVWSGQQIQQQVNASRASTDQRSANQQRTQREEAGSRGFGARSPLLAALGLQSQNQALATNVGNERQIRSESAKMNAEHLLGSQRAQEEQFASRMQEDISRRRPMWDMNIALISALAGLA